MAIKRKEDPPQGAAAWMSTFSDLMNLLLCFFVMLFAMSTMDAEKYSKIVESFKGKTFADYSISKKMLEIGYLMTNFFQLVYSK